ncbi:MAG: putative dehydrogenase, partial [Modestobacter sp.]|nr:putative dehydrogenase [Modestobacter sp.]
MGGMPRLSRLVAVPLVLVAWLLLTGTASAEQPSRLTQQITDTAGALSEVSGDQAAIDRLRSDQDIQLFVVFVRTFDGATGTAWAQRTAELSGLGGNDLLFAVAVDERAYGWHPGDAVGRSNAEIAQVISDDVESRLAQQDWDGAVVALADGLRSGTSGTSGTSGASGGSGGGAALAAVGGIAVLGGGGYLLVRSRRRRTQADAQRVAAARAADPFPDETTEQLTYRASGALLDLDEAARTSALELDFARAQYGEEPVAGFAEALAQSQAELQQAFTLRQQLDDEIPEDEPTRRRMLAEVLRLTGSADARLDAQAEAFDQLRDLERSAPQALDRLAPQVAALQQRLPQEEQRLTQLRERYADSALAPVADNVAQARARLEAAAAEVEEARGHVQGGQAGQAVGSLRVAEDAVAQSGTLLDGIGRLAADLDAAPGRLAAVRAETEQDLAEARSLLGGAVGDPTGLAPLVARVEAAVAAADAVPGGQRPDPLAALRRLEEADAALDQALAGARDAATQARRAAAALDQTVLIARSAIDAAADFIGTRRGAVGAEARTRLAEAQRRLDAAVG